MMTYAQMQDQMIAFLMTENDWHHASRFIHLFMFHCNEKVTDVRIRTLCKSIRKTQRGYGATVLSTIEDGYRWSADTAEILQNGNYWRRKALSRLQTAADITRAVSGTQESLVL